MGSGLAFFAVRSISVPPAPKGAEPPSRRRVEGIPEEPQPVAPHDGRDLLPAEPAPEQTRRQSGEVGGGPEPARPRGPSGLPPAPGAVIDLVGPPAHADPLQVLVGPLPARVAADPDAGDPHQVHG